MTPPLALSYSDPIAEEVFAELKALVASAGTPIEITERDPSGPQAGIEWLLPTAVILYIGKPYFEGFLKEMGKDHYALLKQGVKSLYDRLIGAEAPVLTLFSSSGRIQQPQTYSLVFSLLAEASDGLRFKLLISQSATREEYDVAITAFIEFLDSFHAKKLPAAVIEELNKGQVIGKTMLLAYSPAQGRIVPIDATPAKLRRMRPGV